MLLAAAEGEAQQQQELVAALLPVYCEKVRTALLGCRLGCRPLLLVPLALAAVAVTRCTSPGARHVALAHTLCLFCLPCLLCLPCLPCLLQVLSAKDRAAPAALACWGALAGAASEEQVTGAGAGAGPHLTAPHTAAAAALEAAAHPQKAA